MKHTKEEILNALQVIKDMCIEKDCINCPFGNDESLCRLNSGVPINWKIKKMVTKEQCVNALFDLKNQLEDVIGEESENIEIDEHFKDKKSLEERFKDYKGETIKENPWGDRYADECSKQEINQWIFDGYGIPPIREKDDVD